MCRGAPSQRFNSAEVHLCKSVGVRSERTEERLASYDASEGAQLDGGEEIMQLCASATGRPQHPLEAHPVLPCLPLQLFESCRFHWHLHLSPLSISAVSQHASAKPTTEIQKCTSSYKGLIPQHLYLHSDYHYLRTHLATLSRTAVGTPSHGLGSWSYLGPEHSPVTGIDTEKRHCRKVDRAASDKSVTSRLSCEGRERWTELTRNWHYFE